MSHRFSLAPMSPLIRVLTIGLLFLPLGFALWALIAQEPIAGFTCLFLIVLYSAVWFGTRPTCFVVAPSHLEIQFPTWNRRISMGNISQVRIINKETFQEEFGGAIRIGVGGLWGGFGWLWTTRRGLVEFYISQMDEFVLVDRLTGNRLLITPEHPDQFVAVMQEILAELS